MWDEGYLVSRNFGEMESVYRYTQWWTLVHHGALQIGPQSSISGYQLVPRLETHNPARQQRPWPFKCNCSSYTTGYKGQRKETACYHLVLASAKNHPPLHYWTHCSLLSLISLALCFVFWYLLLVFLNWGPIQFFSLMYRLRTLATKFWLLFLNFHALLILVVLLHPSTNFCPIKPLQAGVVY